MKKFLPLIICISVVTTGYAKGLDLQNRILLNRAKMERAGVIKNFKVGDKADKAKTRGSEAAPNNDNYIRAIVEIADGYTVGDIEAAGYPVMPARGNIVVVAVPIDEVEEFSNLESIKKMSIEKPLNTNMNIARAVSGVDDIHAGKGLSNPYTGKGVNVAIVDQGIDPDHIAFKDEEGKNRIKFLTYFDGYTADSDGLPAARYFGENITYEDDKGNIQQYPGVDQFYTDMTSAYHGTHTLNILGGGYHGDVTYYENGKEVTGPNPFYGVAPESNLTVSCGSLQDACVVMGIANLLSYADYNKEEAEVSTPTIMSLSLGSTAGPHDPNSLMNRFLSECGKDYIIVLSSGNEGDLKIALNKTLTAEDNTLQSMVYPYGFQYDPSQGAPSHDNTYVRNGVVMVYSDDETPFTLQAFIMTGSEGNYRKRATFNLTSEDGNYYSSSSYYINYVGGSVNTTVGRYFDGYIGGGAKLDEDLGRFYGAFDYYLYTNPETGMNEDGSEGVIVGFEITGVDGQRIDCYCDGMNTWIYNYGLEGYQDGSRDGSISDMAVGDNVLVVGAYNTRNNWTTISGDVYGYENEEGFKSGQIGPYTSYGTLADGRTLPHVCAPGTAIMSAVSNPWIESYFKGYESYIPKNVTGQATIKGQNYYWQPETGTSMSTPFVAGSIALWLQANPDLTIDDVLDIIAKTSVKDDDVMAGIPAQWGAGKFDAYAGLKEAINNAGVESITIGDRNDKLLLQQTGSKEYNVFVGNATNLDVKVYSLAGSQMFSKTYPGNEANIDLSHLPTGIYVVKVNRHAAKIVIK
ncbi:MAG: S8 family serine peptidase [Muribaculaceae bacterium]|nr:S8 family serine peptidase [Muribaculaceae bacterium]